MGNQNNEPYEALGARLKFLREQWQQSIHEVSGTLEIEEGILKDIEAGKALPPSDMLDMLISHFLLTEDQADDLRDLAEPQSELINDNSLTEINDMLSKQVIMYLPVDSRVVYTDSMQANVNDNGVMLQFMQQIPNNQQPAVVSRVGMSRDHAEKIIAVLTQTLKQYDANKKPKHLSGPEQSSTQ
jgi:hypothetical protein